MSVRNCKITNLCCLEPLSVWSFVTVATEIYYKGQDENQMDKGDNTRNQNKNIQSCNYSMAVGMEERDVR